MLTAFVFSLDEFPPLRGLKHFFALLLRHLHLSGTAGKMEVTQQESKWDERSRREHAEVMGIKYPFKKAHVVSHFFKG